MSPKWNHFSPHQSRADYALVLRRFATVTTESTSEPAVAVATIDYPVQQRAGAVRENTSLQHALQSHGIHLETVRRRTEPSRSQAERAVTRCMHAASESVMQNGTEDNSIKRTAVRQSMASNGTFNRTPSIHQASAGRSEAESICQRPARVRSIPRGARAVQRGRRHDKLHVAAAERFTEASFALEKELPKSEGDDYAKRQSPQCHVNCIILAFCLLLCSVS
jgi:hypothetical protein